VDAAAHDWHNDRELLTMTNKTGAATLESSVRAVSSIAGTVTHLNTAAEGHIEIQDLSVSYDKRVVLEGVSLRVPRNSVTALIGPSGCGKSSLLHCLNRLNDLVPECSVSGSISFSWMDSKRLLKDPTQLRRQVGMLFQRPNPFPFSIRKNLEFALRQHGIKGRDEIDARSSPRSRKWACGKRYMIASMARLWRCLAGNSSACVSPGRWYSGRRCS
jgi:phosphate transport system ATP-binding protein